MPSAQDSIGVIAQCAVRVVSSLEAGAELKLPTQVMQTLSV